MMDHSSRTMFHRGYRFTLVGFGDFWEDPSQIGSVIGNLPGEGPVLAFTHNPDLFPEIPATVSLTVAGHTHGGQVRLPGLGTPIVPSRYGSRYVRGLVEENGRTLFVTSGLGSSILPVRFRVPPEVVLLVVGPSSQ